MKGPAQNMLIALLLGIIAFLVTRGIQNDRRNHAFLQEVAALEKDTRANLAWMRKELGLTDEEFARECEIHDAHMVEYRRLCSEMNASRERLKQALQNNDEASEEGQTAISDYEKHFEACERAVIQHIKKVASAMNPKAGQTYLKLMLPHLFPDHDPALQSAVPTQNPP